MRAGFFGSIWGSKLKLTNTGVLIGDDNFRIRPLERMQTLQRVLLLKLNGCRG